MFRPVLTAVLIASTLPAAAQVYRCEVDGQTVFSDRPCGENQQEVEVRSHTPAEPAWDFEAARGEQRHFLREQELERAVRRSEARIRELQRERDAEIAALRRSQRYSANNLAGATRDQGLAQEMQAVASNYETLIATERDRLRDLRAQLAEHHRSKE